MFFSTRRTLRRQREVRRLHIFRWHTSLAGPPENQGNKPQEAPMQTNPPDNPYAKYAPKVWSLYMDETEAEDKELVQLWKTSLDSLLIFVRVILHFLGRKF